MSDFNELVKNLYTSKNRELTQEKLDYINKNYAGKEEDFVKNFYATIGEDLPEDKFNYIRDTYLSKKKNQSTPSFSTNLGDFTKPLQVGAEKPSINQSPLASNLKLASEKKQINPFTASKEELTQVYGEDYSREKQLIRQKNYTQGLERLSKRVETLLPQYEKQVIELDNLDNQLKTLEQNPNEYNQLLQVRNQKVNDVIKLADNLRAEKVKADIYEKGLSATDLLRRSKEDTLSNRIQSGLNSLGIMATTTLPAIARGAKLVESYAQAKAMGLSSEDTDLYNRAQAEISKQNWKGLTDIAREFYDKNQILEGGFSKESGFEKIKQGDYKAAGGLLAKELLQNLPVTLGIGLTFANPLLGATYTIGGTAGMELQDMDINNPNMSEQAKIANAFVKGGSEYVTEKIFGTFNYLGRIAGGSIKSEAGKKMLLGSVKEAYEQVAKRLGLGADVIEEISTEVLNKLVGDYADYKSGKTTELEFKKGLGETITTALSTSLLLGGAGRAGKYGYKKIDELRNKAKELQNIAANPEVKPEIANAAKEEVLNVNEQIGNEAEKAQAKYNAMPEETQNKVDELVAEKTQTEQLLQEPELPKEIIPSLEAKLETIQTEIDNTYSEIKPKEKTIEEKISEAETTITPSSNISSEVSEPSSVTQEEVNVLSMLNDAKNLTSTEKKILYKQFKSGVMSEKDISKYTNIEISDIESGGTKWTRAILEKTKGKNIQAEDVEFEELPPSDKEIQETEPTIKEGEGQIEKGNENEIGQGSEQLREEKIVPPVVEQTTTDVGGVKTPSVSEVTEWDSPDGKKKIEGEISIGDKQFYTISIDGKKSNALIPKSDLQKEIDLDKSNLQFKQESDKAREENEIKKQKEIESTKDLKGFGDELPPMQKAKLVTALNTNSSYKGVIKKRKSAIEEFVANGYVVSTLKNGKRILQAPDGTFFDALTKAELDYADYLITNNLIEPTKPIEEKVEETPKKEDKGELKTLSVIKGKDGKMNYFVEFPNGKTKVVGQENYDKLLEEYRTSPQPTPPTKEDGSNPELVKAVEELLITKTNDKENTTRVQSNEREGQEPIKTKPNESTSGEKTETSGVLQKEEVDKFTIQKDNLVNDISTYNKLSKAAKASKRGIAMFNKIKTNAKNLGLNFTEKKDKIEVLNTNGKKITKSRANEIVEEPTDEAYKQFDKLFKNGVITPQINSNILEPTQIKDVIDSYKKGKITKDAKRLINELSIIDKESVVNYKEYDKASKTWVNYSVPLSEMIEQEISTNNLTEEEINQLNDMFDETFSNIDEDFYNNLNNIFYETEDEQNNKSKDNVSTTSSSEKAKSKTNPKVVELIDKVLEAEYTEKGTLINSKVNRTQNRKTTLKEAQTELSGKEKATVETIVNNYDKIRDTLFNKGLIKKISCDW